MAKQKVGTLYGKPIVKGGGENGNEITKNEIKLIEKNNLISLQKRDANNKISNITGGGNDYSDYFVPFTYNDITEVKRYENKDRNDIHYVYYTDKPIITLCSATWRGTGLEDISLLSILFIKTPIPGIQLPEFNSAEELVELMEDPLNVMIFAGLSYVALNGPKVFAVNPFYKLDADSTSTAIEIFFNNGGGSICNNQVKELVEFQLQENGFLETEETNHNMECLTTDWKENYPNDISYALKYDIDKFIKILKEAYG